MENKKLENIKLLNIIKLNIMDIRKKLERVEKLEQKYGFLGVSIHARDNNVDVPLSTCVDSVIEFLEGTVNLIQEIGTRELPVFPVKLLDTP